MSLAEWFKLRGQKLGVEVEVIGYELDTQVPLAVVGKVEQGLKWTDPDILDDIEAIVKREGINIIMPFVNGAMEIASLCKERMPEVFVPVSSYDITAKMFDKQEAAKLYKENGFDIPRTYTIIDNEMPAIVKPRKGGRSRGIQIFYDVEDMMHLENLDNYIIQEYIANNQEYTVDCYVSGNSEILVTVPRERIEVMGGEVTRTCTCHSEQMESTSREVISKLGLTGPVTLQFLHDLDRDKYLLMEVNPRLGGGVICSIAAGAPILDYILLESMGKPVEACRDWRPGVLMARYRQEAIFENGRLVNQ